MRITKKALSIILAIAMLITAVPMGITGFAADVSIGTEATDVNTAQSDTLIRPSGTISVTPVTRVCASTSTPLKGVTGTGVTIAATPSGMGKNSYTYAAAAYAGETPTPTTIVFTPGVEVTDISIECSNPSIQFVNYTISNGAHRVEVADGCSASVGETLIFTIKYKYVYTDSQTGKTYNSDKVFETTGYSYVESVLEPAGAYAYRRTNNGWGGTKNRAYLSTFILGEATYSESTTRGSANFNGGGFTSDYGTMLSASSDGNLRQYNVAYQADSNRPVTHVYMDKGSNSTLADLNLRLQSYAANESDEDNEITTNTVANLYEYSGNVKTYDGETEEDPEQGGSNSSALALQMNSGSFRKMGTTLTMGFAGTGPAQANSAADTTATYTVVVDFKTAAQWSDIWMRFSHTIHVTVFDKTAVRTNVQKVMNTEAANMLITTGAADGKGYNPQEWYYSSGWQAFEQAYNQAQSIYAKPNTTQSEITNAATKLATAYNGLILAEADYTELDYWMSRASALDSTLYTPASWAVLAQAVAKYQDNVNILYQPTIDQLSVDIQNAINNLEMADADYTKVSEKVSEVNALIYDIPADYGLTVEEYYSNWSDLVKVVESCGYEMDQDEGEFILKTVLKIDKQSTVDTYPSAISAAITALNVNKADFTDAVSAINRYTSFRSSNASYLDSSYLTALDSAYQTVYGLYSRSVTIDQQANVDDAVAALNDLLDNPVYKSANYANADRAIARADALVRENYVDLTAVDEAYEALEALYGLDARQQAEVDAAVAALNKAIDELTQNAADYSKVEEAKQAVEDKKLEIQSLYGMDASVYYSNWSAVESAVNAVVYGLPFTQQATINGYATAINSALKALKVAQANYTELLALEDVAYAIVDNESSYTQDSMDNLIEALFAITSHTLTIDKQSTVDKWAADLDAAIKAMKYIEADYSGVDAAILAANAKIAESQAFADAHNGVQYYTADSIVAVQNAIKAVVRGLDKNQQATVNGYATAINNAVSFLTPGPADYSEVDKAVASVPADLSIYTSETVATLNAALNYNQFYTTNRQSKVDEAAAKILEAIEGLKVKGLDTSAYYALVIPADTSLYTDASVQAVTDADAAIVTFLAVDRTYADQADFDALVSVLDSAIKNLAYKPIDTAEYNAVKVTIPTDLSGYTDDSVKAVADADAAITTFLAGDVNISHQASLDALVDALADAISKLEVKVTAYFRANADSTCVISGGYITGLQVRLTAAVLKNTYLDFEGVTVDAVNPAGGRFLGTGSVVTVEYPDGTVEEYIIIIYGDMNGDGTITTTDLADFDSTFVTGEALTEPQKKAMNVDGSRRVDLADLSIVESVITSGGTFNQVDPTL